MERIRLRSYGGRYDVDAAGAAELMRLIRANVALGIPVSIEVDQHGYATVRQTEGSES